MNLLQTFRIALRALRRNPMRSFLTMLGVIIGVSAVIAMVAIGEGAKAMVEKAFDSMGSNMLIIMPGTTTAGGSHGGFGSLPTLTWEDLEAIGKEAPAVRYVSPSLRDAAQVIAEDQNWSTGINGVAPEYFAIRDWGTSKGELFSDSDVDSGRKVVVLGQTVSERLFGPSADPVGQTVRIKKIPFQVIGLLEKKGQSPVGQDFDDTVMMPYTTFQSKIQGGMEQYVGGVIFIGAVSAEATRRAEKQVTELLRDQHQLREGEDDDFSIRNLTEMANASQAGTQTLTTLLACIAAVSLLVGGIGIMNIMLVSVTERTREIGLRMAVGAKPRHILAQFLVEALTLAVAGGAIGIVLGLLMAQWVSSRFSWPFLIRPDIIVLSVVFSGLVGVVFGLYPARKASRLDPIEALRYE
ncbi:MAG: FtsX-like permease family protein [Myxococcales bacterium]|nr:MAG: FtsX-like permease family protein [Myxococcales bacterium]